MYHALVPAQETSTSITVVNSHFIATLAPAFSVEEARAFIARLRKQYADATHNVPAYLIGHGASLIAHCNDDGEPSGTAGRPALTVLQGSGLGDVALVVTRYFGGTRLGTGGLVRAYTEAVKAVLEITPRAEKLLSHTLLIAVPYTWYERLKILIDHHQGLILDEDFGVDVTLSVRFAVDHFPAFQVALTEASQGTLQALIVETKPAIIPIDTIKGN